MGGAFLASEIDGWRTLISLPTLMELSDLQKKSVVSWVQANRSVGEVQRLLREEFGLSLTYMDVRFLIDDLDIALVDAPESSDEAASGAKAVEAAEAELVDEPAGVSVDVDIVMRPGALVSGTVRFSDGKSLGWQLSASGQLGLIPDEDDPQYRPSTGDLQDFQLKLEEVLRQKGF